MAYAAQSDVEAILPEDEDVPTEAEERLATNLEEATDLVSAFLHREYTGEDAEPDPDGDGVPDDVPGAVRRVVARVALRAFIDAPDNPGAVAETNLMGPFSHTINWSKEAQARDFYLTYSDEQRLKPYVLLTARSAAHAPMVGGGGQECPWWR